MKGTSSGMVGGSPSGASPPGWSEGWGLSGRGSRGGISDRGGKGASGFGLSDMRHTPPWVSIRKPLYGRRFPDGP